MSRKFLAGIIAMILVTSCLTISVFAGTIDDLKTAKASLNDSSVLRKASFDNLSAKANEHRTELGIVKITDEQKIQLKVLQAQLVPLREQITVLKAQLAAAIKSKDAAAVKSVKAQFEVIKAKIAGINSQIAAITGGKKSNIDEIKAFNSIMKSANDQKASILDATKQNSIQIKALYEELKAARLNKNKDEINKIIDRLITKIILQKSSFDQITKINNDVVIAID